MTGLYYAMLALIAGAVYVLSVKVKKKGWKVGVAICYVILFLMVLLFV